MEKTGKIKTIAGDGVTGTVTEDGTVNEFDFIHPGADVEFVEGEEVTYIVITTPSGHKIAREIVKKPVEV